MVNVSWIGNMVLILIEISIAHGDHLEHLIVNVVNNIEDLILFHKNNLKLSKHSLINSKSTWQLIFIRTEINGFIHMLHNPQIINFKATSCIHFIKTYLKHFSNTEDQ
jgi:hypothetical protein